MDFDSKPLEHELEPDDVALIIRGLSWLAWEEPDTYPSVVRLLSEIMEREKDRW